MSNHINKNAKHRSKRKLQPITVSARHYVLPVKYTSSKLKRMPKDSERKDIPKAYMLSGLVSVKAVSPIDALTTLCGNFQDVRLFSKILSDTTPLYELSLDDDPYIEIPADPDTIECLTNVHEDGFIDNVVDSGLVSELAKRGNRTITDFSQLVDLLQPPKPSDGETCDSDDLDEFVDKIVKNMRSETSAMIRNFSNDKGE